MMKTKAILKKALLMSCVAVLLLYSLLFAPISVRAAGASGVYVSITKTITASDINWANGNPIFIFELSTIEGISQNNIKYYTAIEFTPDYVNAHTDENNKVSKTVQIMDVLEDEYSLTEQDTIRYTTTNITNVVNGVVYDSYFKQLPNNQIIEIQKKEVEFNLVKNSHGSATFEAEKNNWANASHTDIVINEFSYN